MSWLRENTGRCCNKELAKKEIQEGLIKACDCIDLIIEILRGSKNQKQVKECLVNGVTEGIRFKTRVFRESGQNPSLHGKSGHSHSGDASL